ncbi:prepilin-type N-terminal cleavage/methylation domain-containing protein [Billgrantia azerbaijanica]|nr:prepilin-type N-terminal cleavage/methylation domain-containing protein [Halomonas azerbaijanica]
MKQLQSASQGFSLVELMVAMLIGLVITLGAGQLFLTGFQNFQKIEGLSDKQAAFTFAADVLVKDIRRADLDVTCSAVSAQLSLSVDGECHYYQLYDSGSAISLRLNVDGEGWQPVVNGFRSAAQFQSDNGEGLFTITFRLTGEDQDIVFYAMNRTEAVAGS